MKMKINLILERERLLLQADRAEIEIPLTASGMQAVAARVVEQCRAGTIAIALQRVGA